MNSLVKISFNIITNLLLKDKKLNKLEKDKLLDAIIFKKNKRKHKDYKYGWLSPEGEFTYVEWGCHQDWALEYVKSDKKLFNEYFKSNLNCGSLGDYLIYFKGWVLLHNTHFGVPKPEYNKKFGINKIQREFLNRYYNEMNEPEMAIRYKY